MKVTRTSEQTSRPRRAPVNGSRNVLTATGKEPGFQYRFVKHRTGDLCLIRGDRFGFVMTDPAKAGDEQHRRRHA